MIFSRHFQTTNETGARSVYKIGAIINYHGERWRVTKHKPMKDSPFIIHVYGRRIS